MTNRRAHLKVVVLSAAVLSAIPTITAQAQTSGTYIGASGGSWSVSANWQGGVIPDGGGSATFVRTPHQFTTLAVLTDLPNVTLSQITMNQRNTIGLQRPTGGTTQILTLTGPAIITTTGMYGETPISFAPGGHQISLPVAGSAGLVKNGSEALFLLATANTYTGNTTVNSGILGITSDASLGAAAGTITINGGGLQVRGATNSSRNMTLNATATFQSLASFDTTGILSGAGGLMKQASYGSSITLRSANTFAGPLTIAQGVVSLASAGTAAPSEIIIGGQFDLNNGGTGGAAVNNRITNAAPVTMRGGILTVSSSTSTGTTNTFGALTLNGGTSQILPGTVTSNTSILQFASLTRTNAAILFAKAQGLGDPAIAKGKILFTTPPAMIGTSTTAGTTNLKVIPYAFGGINNSDSISANTNTLLTYDSVGGLRPLDSSSEVVSSINTAASDDNVYLSGDDPVSTAQTVNSLTMSDVNLSGTGAITVTSGAILSTGNTTVTTPPIDSFFFNRIQPDINFGSAEGNIIAPARIDIQGVISGTGGLNLSANGSFIQIASDNTYTGGTKIGAAIILPFGDTPKDGVTPSSFGQDTSAIQILGNVNARAGIYFDGPTSTVVVDRDILVPTPKAETYFRALLGDGGTAANQNIILNGSITLQQDAIVTFEGVNSGAGTMTVNGKITGPGVVSDTAFIAAAGSVIARVSSRQVFNAANDYSGGTEIKNGVYLAGNDQAFGTGTIWFATTNLTSATVPTIGALGAVGAPRTLANYIEMRSQDPITAGTTAFTGVVFAGDSPLKLTGTIDLGSSNTRLITVAGPTPQNIDFAGPINYGGIFKRGAGTLTLSGTGLYGGQLTVDAGPVVLKSATALGVNNPTAFANGNPNFAQNGGFIVVDGSAGNLAFGNEDIVLTTTSAQQPNGTLVNIAGNNSINGALFISSGDHTVNIQTGSKWTSLMRDNSGTIVGGASLTKIGGGELVVDRVRFATITGAPNPTALNINDGTVSLTGSGTLDQGKVQDLNIAAGRTLNIGNTGMIVDYTGTTPFAALKAKIVEGRTGGTYTGTGIRSSAVVSSGTGKTGIGIAEVADVVNPAGVAGEYQGQVVDADAVIIAHTYLGDANLDRKVDSTDFNASVGNAANYGLTSGGEWTKGDFNYDDKVNTLDFNEFAGNFGLVVLPGSLPGSEVITDNLHPSQAVLERDLQASFKNDEALVYTGLPGRGADGGSLGSVVPEPGSITLLALAGAALLGRQRRI